MAQWRAARSPPEIKVRPLETVRSRVVLTYTDVFGETHSLEWCWLGRLRSSLEPQWAEPCGK